MTKYPAEIYQYAAESPGYVEWLWDVYTEEQEGDPIEPMSFEDWLISRSDEPRD
jgi:hypothetical protein